MPQAFDRLTTFRFHRSLILALLPVVGAATVLHGLSVLLTVGLAVFGAWGADLLLSRWRREAPTLDLGAPLGGLLLALLLPVQAPWYLPLIGSLFSIFVVKGIFGASGTPWVNPVLASWAFLQTGWGSLFPSLSPLSEAHRTVFDERATEWANANVFSWLSIQLPPGYMDLFLGWGHPAASLIVESGSIFLLIATVYLLGKGAIPWAIPTSFFLAFSIPMVLAGGNTLVHIFSGTFLLNLFFLATDPSSRPLGRWNLVVYGALAGFLAFLLRTWGTGPDGVGYAVLMMNAVVPWFEQRFRRKALNDFRLA